MRNLIFCLVLLLLPGFALAQSEESDRGFIQGILEDNLSGPGRTVRIEGFAGALSSRATIDKVTVADADGIWITMTDVAMVWNRSALLSARIEIDEISVGTLDLPRLPLPTEETASPEAAGEFSLPDLPAAVAIKEFRIDKAILGEPLFGEAAEVSLLGSATMADGTGDVKLDLLRLDKEGALALAGTFENETRRLGLDLELAEPEGGIAVNLLGIPGHPSIRLAASGDDPISDFKATLQLATDGQQRLAGDITLRTTEGGASEFAMDVGGDVAPVFAPAYRDFLGTEIRLVAEGARDQAGALDLDVLRIRAAALQLEGAASIGADGWPQLLQLNGAIVPQDGNHVVLPLPGTQTSVASVTLRGSFDAGNGDAWILTGRAMGVERDGTKIRDLGFSGEGTLSRENQRVNGGLILDAGGLQLATADLARAIGTRLDGELRFAWAKDAPLQLSDVDLSGLDYGVTGSAEVFGLDGLETLTVAPDLTLVAEDLTRFAGLAGIELSGAADLAIAGQVSPLTGLADLEFNGSTTNLATGIAQLDPLLEGVGTLEVAVTRDEQGLTVSPLKVRTSQAQIDASGRLRSDGSMVSLQASVDEMAVVVEELQGPAQLNLEAEQAGETWQVTLNGSLPGDASVGYRGIISGDGKERLSATGIIEAAVGQLAQFSTLAGRDLAGSADLRAEGNVDILKRFFDLSVTGQATGLRFGLPQIETLLHGTTDMAVVARRNEDGLVAERVSLRNSRAEIDGSGRLQSDDSEVSLKAALTDVADILDDLSGPAQLRLDASQAGDAWDVDLDGDLPGGTRLSYRGAILGDGKETLAAAGVLEAASSRLDAFSTLAGRDLNGAAQLRAEGSVDILERMFDIAATGKTGDLRIGIPQVDKLLRGDTSFDIIARRTETEWAADRLIVRGDRIQIDGAGKIGADGDDGRVALDASLTDVGDVLGGINGQAQIDLQADQAGETWQVSADGDLPGNATISYRGTVTGDGREKLAAEGLLDAAVGQLGAYSGLAGRPLAGALDMRAEGAADILAATFDIVANGETRGLRFGVATVDPLLSGTNRFDIDVERDASGQVRIDRLDLQGTGLTAGVSGAFGPNDGSATYNLTIDNVARIVPDFAGPARVNGTADRQGSIWQIAANGTGPGGITMEVRGRVDTDGPRLDLSLNGLAPLALANNFLQGQAVAGQVRYNLAVNGPPQPSSVSGRLSFVDARLALPAQGIALNEIRGEIDLAGGTAQIDMNSRVSSGGRLRITGPVSLDAPFNARLAADLINVTLRDESLYEADLDGRITVDGPLTGGARIGGTVSLDTVEMRLPNIGPSYSILEGLRHIAPPAEVQQTLRFAGLTVRPEPERSGPSYPIDLLVSAPNRLFVRGRGLDAELGGSLRLTGTTRDLVPVGQFNLIRGRLDLLGRRLDLTEGSVSLRGSFDPVINFAASAEVEEVVIVLRIQGLASAPELTVTSEPELPQDEALSLFLFGRDVTSISALQAVQLAAAIRTLSGSGPGISDTLRIGLGLDDLDIGTGDDGQAQARVGKYISENIYTDVTVDSTGSSQINLNLDLTDRVTVRGRLANDGETALGIFYERDY